MSSAGNPSGSLLMMMSTILMKDVRSMMVANDTVMNIGTSFSSIRDMLGGRGVDGALGFG